LARQRIEDARTVPRKNKREALRKLNVYLKNNQDRINYAKHQAAGLPIGSGMIKSQCKRNWRKAHAEAVLRFRAARIDKEFNNLWSKRLNVAA